MRRKNWTSKRNHFYGSIDTSNQFFFNVFLKKKELKYDEYNTLGQLYKVFVKKNKNSIILPELNYYFYLSFFKNLKKNSRNIIFKNYIKNLNKNILIFLPSYTFKSQFFNNKSLFDDVLVNFKLKGFFIHKSFYNSTYKVDNNFYKKHIVGYNFYTLKSNFEKYSNIYKILDDKDYNSVGKVKLFIDDFLKNNSIFSNEINLFFIFNVLILKILEIYKILVYLYLNML